MERVNIYIGINPANTRKSKKRYGFVLECIRKNEPQTVERFGDCEETYNGATLKALNLALERMIKTCEIHIHTENTYILSMIEKNLDLWVGTGFTTSKGEPLKSQEEWRKLWQHSVKHLLVSEPGKHTYLEWIKETVSDDEKYEKQLEKQRREDERKVRGHK